jgi:UPF0755 protein
MKFNRKMKIILAAVLVFDLMLAGLFALWMWSGNVRNAEDFTEILIPTGSAYTDVYNLLADRQALRNMSSFDIAAMVFKYKKNSVPPGRYLLKHGMNSFEIVRMLRAGYQTPVKLTFNNIRTKEELSGKLAAQIEPDSLSILSVFRDTELIKSMGYNEYNFLSLFIPNTYEMYWTASPASLLKRMQSENQKFWNSRERSQKAAKLGLTHQEVYILASIVEKETLVSDEKPIIASVYLNRLRRGQKLQADPTVVFAMGDFELRRLLHSHLEYDSPYNTYKYAGLPPGPIFMPDISTIDAVLNYEDTDYLFFCAAPGGTGRHLFAVTYRQHLQNASRYHKWLNENSIR